MDLEGKLDCGRKMLEEFSGKTGGTTFCGGVLHTLGVQKQWPYLLFFCFVFSLLFFIYKQ